MSVKSTTTGSEKSGKETGKCAKRRSKKKEKKILCEYFQSIILKVSKETSNSSLGSSWRCSARVWLDLWRNSRRLESFLKENCHSWRAVTYTEHAKRNTVTFYGRRVCEDLLFVVLEVRTQNRFNLRLPTSTENFFWNAADILKIFPNEIMYLIFQNCIV